MDAPLCPWCGTPLVVGAPLVCPAQPRSDIPDRLTGSAAAESARWDRAEYQAERAIEREHEADPEWAWGESPNGIGGSQW